MRQKNREPRKKYALAALGAAVALGGAGSAAFGFVTWTAEEAGTGWSLEESAELITNQGLGMGLDGTDGSFYPMELLAADRNTGFFVEIETQALQGRACSPLS